MEKDDYVLSSEAAEIIGVTRHRVVAMIRSGRLPAIEMGGNGKPVVFLIKRADLESDAIKNRKPGRPPKDKSGKSKAKKPEK